MNRQSSSAAIVVERLHRSFRTPVRSAGLRAAFGSLARPRYEHVVAVRDLTFTVPSGQLLGLIGPNGAGKTTTMKMLSGVLHPSSGTATVLGQLPYRRSRSFLNSMTLLRGSAPIGGPTELTVLDNLHYRRLLYEIPAAAFHDHLGELIDLLQLAGLLSRQMRTLSLGERMRAGLAVALVHRPQMVFLDEPTIGLDASAALAFRDYVHRYATQAGATVILTSHYMNEIEALCSRVILIDQGMIRFDGPLRQLAASLSPWKEIRCTRAAAAAAVDWERFGEVASRDGDTICLRVSREHVSTVTAGLLAVTELIDLSVADPSLETVLDRYYRDSAR